MTDQEFDVIVVGGGTSGAVVAARLSQDPARRVLLLEAGQTFGSVEAFPPELLGTDENAWVGPEHNWWYTVSLTCERPDPVPVPRGRVIGGSGATNGGIHLRAMPEDFSGWGDGLWEWPDALRCYRRSEHDLDFGPDPAHGDQGPVAVGRAHPDDYTRLYSAFDSACLSVGHPACKDQNAPDAAGVGPMPRNYSRGIRVNAAFAYLFPALHRPNLRVRGDSVVHRVLVEAGRAVGVETIEAGRLVRRNAAAVALCAGALATPCVLLRSGIGSADDLRQLGVDVRADLPGGGAQLRDHATVHVQDRARSGDIFPPPGAPGRNQAVLQLTAPGSTDRNDLQIMPSYRADWLALTVMLNQTVSVGSLRLTSAEPTQNPVIALDYLSRAEDVARLRAGVREAVRIMTTRAFTEISAGGVADGPPGLGDHELDEWIRGHVSTAAHSHGTCPIGPPADGGVVDARGRVHGVDGLSIADVSIVPVPLRNNPNATSLMLGERIAELW